MFEYMIAFFIILEINHMASAGRTEFIMYDGSVPTALIKLCNMYIKDFFQASPEQLIHKNSILLVCMHSRTVASLRSPKVVTELAGFVEVDASGYIGWLVTVPKFQGQGIASNLIEGLKTKFSTLSLHEDSTNEALTNFYMKRGFRKVPELERRVKSGPRSTLLQYFMTWP